jgi:hypothetical protein
MWRPAPVAAPWPAGELNAYDGRIVEHRAFADTTAPGGPHEIATR